MGDSIVTNAWNKTKGFAESFSDASMGTVALSGSSFSVVSMVQDLGVKYAGFAEHPVFDTLKLGFALRLISQPVIMVKSISKGLDAYEICDMTKVVTASIGALRAGLQTGVSAAVVLSIPLNAVATKTALLGSQVLLGSAGYLIPVIEVLNIFSDIISALEVFYILATLSIQGSAKERIQWIENRMYPKIESCSERIKNIKVDAEDWEHIEELRGFDVKVPQGLNEDDILRFLEVYHLEIQKQSAILERAVGEHVLELVKEKNIEEIDTHLRWAFGLQVLSIVWTMMGATFFALTVTGVLPFHLIFIAQMFEDIDGLYELIMGIYKLIFSLEDKAKAGDKALIITSAAILTAVILSVAFIHVGMVPAIALMVIALISASTIQYTYRKAVSDEQLQSTIERIRQLPRE